MTISNISSFYKKRKLIFSYLFFQFFAELKASIGIILRELVEATNKKWRKQYKYLLISYSAHKVICKDNLSSFNTYTLFLDISWFRLLRSYMLEDMSLVTSVQETYHILTPFFSSIFDYVLIFIDPLLPILLSIFTFFSLMFFHPHHTTPYFCEALLVVSGIEKHTEFENS